MEFLKIEKDCLKEFGVDNIECDLVYGLKIEGNVVGFGFLNFRNTSNMLDFYIFKKYQGNGYGKILFGKMLEVLKENNYNELVISFSDDNIKLRSIVEGFNGLEVGRVNGIYKYVVPLK